ncbi:MAG: AAA family ATPase, partial [Candidatus Omnitrophica bacterium]|nr:AAA family ATPase [Candidatus Omnitrophota bacterium]
RGKLPPCVKKISKSDILEGIRDNILYRLAIIFKKNSYLKEATLEMLQRLNKERCKPPLSETEVFKKVDSAYEGAYTGFGCEASYMQEFCDEACFLKKGNILNEDKDFGQPVVLKDFIDNFKDEKIESIWGDGIINYDSKTIISGMGKLGKSNFVMNLGLCIATGRDFLNIRVIKKSKVLYIQQEISSHALYARLKLMLESIGEVDKENFTICNVRGFDILNASHFSQLEKWIREKGYEVVMFDPLYKFHNKEENSTQAMKQVFDKFDELIDKYKISIIIVHHHGKGEKQGGHVLRGSSTIFDWGDSYIILKSSGDSIEVTWELRNAANPRPLKIKLNNNLYYECSAADKKESAINKIVDIVKASSQDGISQKDIVEKAKESIGVSDGTVRNFIKEAKKRKKIKTLDAKQKKGKGVYWSIT